MTPKFLFMLLLLLPTLLSAAEGVEHVPSPADLMWTAINFFLLFGFMGYKARKPLREMFDANFDRVKKSADQAQKNAKDADQKYLLFKEKIENFNATEKSVQEEFAQMYSTLEKNSKVETKKQIERIEKDAIKKLESEKLSRVEALQVELVDNLIKKAKSEIKGNTKLQKSASEKLIADI